MALGDWQKFLEVDWFGWFIIKPLKLLFCFEDRKKSLEMLNFSLEKLEIRSVLEEISVSIQLAT